MNDHLKVGRRAKPVQKARSASNRASLKASASRPRVNSRINNARPIKRQTASRPQALKSVKNDPTLFVLICDAIGLLLAIIGLTAWFSAVVNNPLMMSHLKNGFTAIILKPFYVFIITAILTGLTVLLSYQKVLKSDKLNGCLMILIAYLIGDFLGAHYFGSIMIPAMFISMQIAVMILPVLIIKKQSVEMKDFEIALGIGTTIYLLFIFFFRLSWLSLLIALILDALVLGILYLGKDDIYQNTPSGDISMMTAIHYFPQMPKAVFNRFCALIRK